MANKLLSIDVDLTTTTTTNILNPPTGAGGVGLTATNQYIILKKVTIVNRTGSGRTFSLWIGASGANAAGTEFMGIGRSVAANSIVEWFGSRRMDIADFLVGGADANTAVSIQVDFELAVA